jgi:hypothetical protein
MEKEKNNKDARISVLKILTAFAFLFVTVANPKLSVGMWMVMLGFLYQIFEAGLRMDGVYALIVLFGTLYLMVSGFLKFDSRKDDILSLLSILGMYLLIGMFIEQSWNNANILVCATHLIFGVISLLTIINVFKRIIRERREMKRSAINFLSL